LRVLVELARLVLVERLGPLELAHARLEHLDGELEDGGGLVVMMRELDALMTRGRDLLVREGRDRDEGEGDGGGGREKAHGGGPPGGRWTGQTQRYSSFRQGRTPERVYRYRVKLVHAADLHLDSPLRGLDRYDGAPRHAMRAATRRALEN